VRQPTRQISVPVICSYSQELIQAAGQAAALRTDVAVGQMLNRRAADGTLVQESVLQSVEVDRQFSFLPVIVWLSVFMSSLPLV
jgi:hypothetical protein